MKCLLLALSLAWPVQGLDMLLQLVPCNASDPYQRWGGFARGSEGGQLRNTGSKLCVSKESEQPQQIAGLSAASCGDQNSALVLRHNGTFAQVSTGECLEATYERGVPGTYFVFNRCYGAASPSSADQRFHVNATSGLVESVRLPGYCMQADPFELPRLPIQPGAVISHGFGDMNVAFHFAQSAGLAGVCGHDSQPYHCAVHYFAGEPLVPQTPSSSVPVCDGCPSGMTVLYDHCKNHDEWVDVGKLPDYARGNSKIDDVQNIYNTTVYLSRAECGTYGKNSVVNTWEMYGQMVQNPDEQIRYRDMCAADSPVPYPYKTSPDPFVEAECLQHMYSRNSKMARITGGKALRPPASVGKRANSRAFRQNSFLDSFDVGFDTLGYYYVPDICQSQPAANCTLLVNWHGCGGLHPWDWNGTLARYAESNGIVLLAPKMKSDNNVSLTYTNAHEVARGCWDSYGQTGADYATKLGPHISSGWRMVQHVME